MATKSNLEWAAGFAEAHGGNAQVGRENCHFSLPGGHMVLISHEGCRAEPAVLSASLLCRGESHSLIWCCVISELWKKERVIKAKKPVAEQKTNLFN